jgi:hypothetical protein
VIKLEIKRPSADGLKGGEVGRKRKKISIAKLAIQTSSTPLNKHD